MAFTIRDIVGFEEGVKNEGAVGIAIAARSAWWHNSRERMRKAEHGDGAPKVGMLSLP